MSSTNLKDNKYKLSGVFDNKHMRLKIPNYCHFVSFLVYFIYFVVPDTNLSHPAFYSSRNRKHTCSIVKQWECRRKSVV